MGFYFRKKFLWGQLGTKEETKFFTREIYFVKLVVKEVQDDETFFSDVSLSGDLFRKYFRLEQKKGVD
ncbi:MAG: hypothetical protein DRI99_07630 [Candidatus Aminicenantes bacterium]|nr:MAG: hypothetical protein DRI99_07630 [Candidatus Aminicenantes bacterium]RLE04722.1 MAG: hypothetical protein DRJ11_00180 [Candidatus Aminicenantes bacterium]